jgi:ribosomal protein S18 acetylase RimI-like enzyme
MQIVPLQPAHYDTLHPLYLALTAPAPHCLFQPGPTLFRTGMQFALERGTSIFIAAVRGRAIGLAAITRLRPALDGTVRDAITALFFDSDLTGQQLLAACETQSRAGDASELLAFPNTTNYSPAPCYNGGWDGLSDRIPMVGRLLARNGYRPFHRELHFTCDLERFATETPRKPAGVTLVETADDRGRRTLRALADNRAVGVCVFSTLHRVSDDPETRDWGYLWALGVDVEYREQGLGRFLLRSAMARLHADRCQGMWLTTAADNWPAQALYLTHGFEIVDCSASFTKTIR